MLGVLSTCLESSLDVDDRLSRCWLLEDLGHDCSITRSVQQSLISVVRINFTRPLRGLLMVVLELLELHPARVLTRMMVSAYSTVLNIRAILLSIFSTSLTGNRLIYFWIKTIVVRSLI